MNCLPQFGHPKRFSKMCGNKNKFELPLAGGAQWYSRVIKMQIYTIVSHKDPTLPGHIEAFAGCGCETANGKFRACRFHAVIKAELEEDFLQKAAEDQERYDHPRFHS
jgi:hypothetical protein